MQCVSQGRNKKKNWFEIYLFLLLFYYYKSVDAFVWLQWNCRCVAVRLMEIARGLMLILGARDDCRLGLLAELELTWNWNCMNEWIVVEMQRWSCREIADAGGHNGCDNVFEDLIDFCKDTGLQSSTTATRNSIIKMIGSLFNLVAPDIKGFMSYVSTRGRVWKQSIRGI